MKKNLADLLADPRKQVLLVSFTLFFNLLIAFVLVISPVTSIKGAEPNVIYTIQMTMLNKQWMYQDPESIPFAATQYTPLYYMICSSAANLFSLTPGDEVVSIYRISRAISFLASMLSGYFIFLILYKVYDVNARWSYFTAFICILSTVPWYYATRPDSLMAVFLFSSVYFFGRYLKQDGHWFKYLVAAGILASFSFFSKQNGLIVSVVAGSYLLFHLRIKDLALFTVGFLFGGLALLLLFQGYYSKFFFQHFIEGLNNGTDIQTAIVQVYYSYVSRFGTLTIVTFLLIFIIISNLSFQGIRDEFRFLMYSLVISIPFSIATALKVGSDINYFHEVIGITLIIACAGGQMIRNMYAELDNQIVKVTVFCVSFAFALSLTLSSLFAVGLRNIKRMTERDDVYKKELLSFIREEATKHPGGFHLLSEEAFVNNAFPLQSVLPHNDIASVWYARKVFDFANLKKAVSQGKIMLYVGNGNKLRYYDIDLEYNFSLIKTIEGYKVYKTKNISPP